MKEPLKNKLNKTLFHGTLEDRAIGIMFHGIDFSKLNDRADFGKGLYLTDSYALAEKTAITRCEGEKLAKGDACKPVILRVKVSNENFEKLNIKEFYGETNAWKRFICANRWHDGVGEAHPEYDNNVDAKYDIVIGLTADGKMGGLEKLIRQDGYNLSDSVIKDIIPFKTKYKKTFEGKEKEFPTKSYQISIHSNALIESCIDYEGYDIIELGKEDGDYE